MLLVIAFAACIFPSADNLWKFSHFVNAPSLKPQSTKQTAKETKFLCSIIKYARKQFADESMDVWYAEACYLQHNDMV